MGSTKAPTASRQGGGGGFRLKPVAINKRRRGTMLGKTGIISPQSAIARATEQVHSYVAICRYTRAQVKSLESEGRIADS